MKLVLISIIILISPKVFSEINSRISLEQVLDSIDRHSPLIKSEIEKINLSRAQVEIAKSSFDLNWQLSSGEQKNGYPENRKNESKIQTQIFGTGILATLAWDEFDGTVPVYRQSELTGSEGRLKASLQIPLLRNLLTDPNRTNLEINKLNLNSTEQSFRFAKMQIYIKAALSYYNWLASIEKRKISEDLLQLALQRREFINKKVKLGDSPKIDLIEIERIIFERENNLLKSSQNEFKASQDLSLFLRDTEGQVKVPQASQAKNLLQETQSFNVVDTHSWNFSEFPILKSMELLIQAQKAELKLFKQERLPKLNLVLENSEYYGDLPINRQSSTESFVGFTLTFPILNLEAKGKYSLAQAKVNSKTQEMIFLRDQLKIRFDVLSSEYKTAYQLYQNSLKEIKNSQILSEAARRKYEKGAVDLFMVNTREVEEANSQIQSIELFLNFQNLNNEILLLQNKWIRTF